MAWHGGAKDPTSSPAERNRATRYLRRHQALVDRVAAEVAKVLEVYRAADLEIAADARAPSAVATAVVNALEREFTFVRRRGQRLGHQHDRSTRDQVLLGLRLQGWSWNAIAAAASITRANAETSVRRRARRIGVSLRVG